MPSEQQQPAEYSDDAIWAVLRIGAAVSVVGAAVGPFVVEGGVGTAVTVGVLVANIAVLVGVAVYGVGSAVWETVATGDSDRDDDGDATPAGGEPGRTSA